jgi:hypothetical protein
MTTNPDIQQQVT